MEIYAQLMAAHNTAGKMKWLVKPLKAASRICLWHSNGYLVPLWKIISSCNVRPDKGTNSVTNEPFCSSQRLSSWKVIEPPCLNKTTISVDDPDLTNSSEQNYHLLQRVLEYSKKEMARQSKTDGLTPVHKEQNEDCVQPHHKIFLHGWWLEIEATIDTGAPVNTMALCQYKLLIDKSTLQWWFMHMSEINHYKAVDRSISSFPKCSDNSYFFTLQ